MDLDEDVLSYVVVRGGSNILFVLNQVSVSLNSFVRKQLRDKPIRSIMVEAMSGATPRQLNALRVTYNRGGSTSRIYTYPIRENNASAEAFA